MVKNKENVLTKRSWIQNTLWRFNKCVFIKKRMIHCIFILSRTKFCLNQKNVWLTDSGWGSTESRYCEGCLSSLSVSISFCFSRWRHICQDVYVGVGGGGLSISCVLFRSVLTSFFTACCSLQQSFILFLHEMQVVVGLCTTTVSCWTWLFKIPQGFLWVYCCRESQCPPPPTPP